MCFAYQYADTSSPLRVHYALRAEIAALACFGGFLNPSLRLVTENTDAWHRLCAPARGDSGRARRVVNILLAWQKAPENGAGNPTDLSSLDEALAPHYPADLGCKREINRIWQLWRDSSPPRQEET